MDNFSSYTTRSLLDKLVIRPRGDMFCVYTFNGERNLGCGRDREWAVWRIANIELARQNIMVKSELADPYMVAVELVDDPSFKPVETPEEVEQFIKSLSSDYTESEKQELSQVLMKHLAGRHDQKTHTTLESHLSSEDVNRISTALADKVASREKMLGLKQSSEKLVSTVEGVAKTVEAVDTLIEMPSKLVKTATLTGKAIKTATTFIKAFLAGAKTLNGVAEVATAIGTVVAVAHLVKPGTIRSLPTTVPIRPPVSPLAPTRDYTYPVKSNKEVAPKTPEVGQQIAFDFYKSSVALTDSSKQRVKEYLTDLIELATLTVEYAKVVYEMAAEKVIGEKEVIQITNLIERFSHYLTVLSKESLVAKHLAGRHDQRSHGRHAGGMGEEETNEEANVEFVANDVKTQEQHLQRGKLVRLDMEDPDSPVVKIRSHGNEGPARYIIDENGVKFYLDVAGQSAELPLTRGEAIAARGRPSGTTGHRKRAKEDIVTYDRYGNKVIKPRKFVAALHKFIEKVSDIREVAGDVWEATQHTVNAILRIKNAVENVKASKEMIVRGANDTKRSVDKLNRKLWEFEESELNPASKFYTDKHNKVTKAETEDEPATIPNKSLYFYTRLEAPLRRARTGVKMLKKQASNYLSNPNLSTEDTNQITQSIQDLDAADETIQHILGRLAVRVSTHEDEVDDEINKHMVGGHDQKMHGHPVESGAASPVDFDKKIAECDSAIEELKETGGKNNILTKLVGVGMLLTGAAETLVGASQQAKPRIHIDFTGKPTRSEETFDKVRDFSLAFSGLIGMLTGAIMANKPTEYDKKLNELTKQVRQYKEEKTKALAISGEYKSVPVAGKLKMAGLFDKLAYVLHLKSEDIDPRLTNLAVDISDLLKSDVDLPG